MKTICLLYALPVGKKLCTPHNESIFNITIHVQNMTLHRTIIVII